MRDEQTFGSCTLYDGGCAGRSRWILHIPKEKFDNLTLDARDRDNRDAVRRIFAFIHGGRSPLWTSEFDTSYAVEFPTATNDTTIEHFVSIIEQNQKQ